MASRRSSWLLLCVIAPLGGCALAPLRSASLSPQAARAAIEAATHIPLGYSPPPTSASDLQSLRASLYGVGPGGTVTALVFWDQQSAADPVGALLAPLRVRSSAERLRVLRRLNVLILYSPRAGEPDLTESLRAALARISPS